MNYKLGEEALGIGNGTDWMRLRPLGDEEIREGIEADPEARATDVPFWKKAKVVLPGTKRI